MIDIKILVSMQQILRKEDKAMGLMEKLGRFQSPEITVKGKHIQVRRDYQEIPGLEPTGKNLPALQQRTVVRRPTLIELEAPDHGYGA